MLFTVNLQAKTAAPVPSESFATLEVRERYDLQEWVLSNPLLLGEDLFVVTSEFDQFDRTSERLDALMLDRRGKLVVVELKRSAVGTMADLQALRYAAYCSTLSLDDVVDLYLRFRLTRSRSELTREEAQAEIDGFLDEPPLEEVDNKPRIILAAEEFPPEMTATLLWLRSFELDISAVRVRPHRIADDIVLESTVLIPLPEAEDFLIRRERKDVDQSSRSRARNEKYREFFQALIDRLREEHRFTNARVGQPINWYSFSSGMAGVTYAAVFTRRQLRAEVYIDLGDQSENKRLFDSLEQRRDEIEREVGETLAW
jgi:hypothetical protein